MQRFVCTSQAFSTTVQTTTVARAPLWLLPNKAGIFCTTRHMPCAIESGHIYCEVGQKLEPPHEQSFADGGCLTRLHGPQRPHTGYRQKVLA
jgi:hypothetical protein